MNEQERDGLIRRMEEAVLLPAEDAERQQLYREILEAGDWAREHWLELVQHDERMRLELLDVEPPSGMADRLRALAEAGPEASLPKRTDGPILSRRRWLGMAASVAALASAGSVLWFSESRGSLDARFHQLGEAVHAHHALPHPVSFASSDPEQVAAHFAGSFAWDVRMPTMGRGYALDGAKVCELAGEPVLCTQWRDGQQQRYTVFQFCAPDHNLPPTFDRRTVEAAGRHIVTFWTEAHCAYVMTSDHQHSAEPIA
ncbi:MAG: hypothetical protein WD294_01330 [Phycisphaeraceae bacterium]